MAKSNAMRSHLRTNSRKYREFHHDYGHDTDDCVDFKEQIESLIKQGTLLRFPNGH